MRDTFVKTLLKIAKKDSNVLIVTGDLGFGVLKPFWDELPEQIINVGIAEQNMTGFATGLALEGKIVFTYSIGNFPTLRSLEQIRNDAAYHNANVKVVCVGGGFVYGALGMSHHATEDIAIMRSLPNVKVLAPGDLVEAQHCTEAIYKTQGTCYLRLGRGGEKQIHNKNLKFSLGRAIKIKEGKDLAILSTGAIFDEVLEADKILNSKGFSASIFTFPTVKPIDRDMIKQLVEKFKHIFTVEEHNILGGFGGAIAEEISSIKNSGIKLTRLGINDKYSSIVGTQKYLRNVYGISGEKIALKIINNMNKVNSYE